MIELIYTSIKTFSYIGEDYYNWFMLYANSPDAMIACNSFYLYKIFRDGTNCFIGNVYDCQPIALNEGRIGWYYNVLTSSTYKRFLKSDEFAFQPHQTEIINSDWLFPTNYTAYRSYIDLNKRLWVGWWIGSSPFILYCINIDSGETLWTKNISTGTTALPIYYVSVDYIMVIDMGGTAYILNINTGELRETFAFPASRLATYDFNHGLLITIDSTQCVNVFLLDRYPASFSAVTSEYGILQAYRGCEIKVRLLSADAFPCPDRLITWELPNFLGSLEKFVSKTDVDGYAWNYYYGPTVAGGTEKIKVGWG